jgi:hypothetical protein
MPIHHEDEEFTAGDDWTIYGTLTEDNDTTPLDLTDVQMIQWVMLGANGLPALPPEAVIVAVLDPPAAGKVAITIPSSFTMMLDPGRYIDQLRVVMTPTVRSSVWTGAIGVNANAFDTFDKLPPPPPPAISLEVGKLTLDAVPQLTQL